MVRGWRVTILTLTPKETEAVWEARLWRPMSCLVSHGAAAEPQR